MTYDPTGGFSKEIFRPTAINWPNEIQEIVDGYYDKGATLSHAVQKDAIQNGWDARINKKGKNWKFTFELIEKQVLDLLTMTDEGTHGLTGKVYSGDQMDQDFPREERWVRFENLAFKNDKDEDSELLGSRGRGKFIFVGASENLSIFYDSMRKDGYRCGTRYALGANCPIMHLDEDKGREALEKFSRGLIKKEDALKTIGTRVVITDPLLDIIDDIKNGKFLKHIGATWWEIITKYNAEINVTINGKTKSAKAYPPSWPEKDSKSIKFWKKECTSIPMNGISGNNLKCKTLHIVYDEKKKVDDELKGIAIQRLGMKVCCLQLDELPRELRDHIYGYVTLESGWDKILRKAEGLEHYSLDFRKEGVSNLKNFLVTEYLEFAEKKIGWGAKLKSAQKEKQKDAEKRALRALNKFAQKMGFLSVFGGGVQKEIRIEMSTPTFPRPGDLRVNWGERLSNISAKIVNDSDEKIDVKLKIAVRNENADIKELHNEDVTVAANSKSNLLGNIKLDVTKSEFPDKG